MVKLYIYIIKKRLTNEYPQKLDTIWGVFMERKVKYDYTFKLECVKLVLGKHHSYLLLIV